MMIANHEMREHINLVESEAIKHFQKELEHQQQNDDAVVGAMVIVIDGLKDELQDLILLRPGNRVQATEQVKTVFEFARLAMEKIVLAADLEGGHPELDWLKIALEESGRKYPR